MIDTKIDKRLSLSATALAAVMMMIGACDVDPGPTTPEPLDASAANDLVALEGDDDPRRLLAQLPPDLCDRMARPSVHAMVVRRYTDYYLPVDVDAVWFEHDGHAFEARCIQGNRGCEAWIAGYDLLGPITVSTEHCEEVVSETVVVEPTSDGCHAQTQFMLLEVSTRECMTGTEPHPPPPTPPTRPGALTTVSPAPPPPGPPDEMAIPS